MEKVWWKQIATTFFFKLQFLPTFGKIWRLGLLFGEFWHEYWLGHLRMPENHWSYKLLHWRPPGRKKRGRPRRSWNETSDAGSRIRRAKCTRQEELHLLILYIYQGTSCRFICTWPPLFLVGVASKVKRHPLSGRIECKIDSDFIQATK